MKKLIVSMALASSVLIAAAPASAQYQGDRDRSDYRDDRRYDDRDRDGRGYQGQDVRQRIERIAMQIDRGQQRGNITPREGQRLRYELTQIRQIARQFQRTGGIDYRERQALDVRIDRLQQRVRFERQDDDRRYDRRSYR